MTAIVKIINRRVDLPPDKQEILSKVFANKKTGKPLSLSTVSNYLNETRYPNQKAQRIREYAIEHLGGIWVTEEKVKR